MIIYRKTCKKYSPRRYTVRLTRAGIVFTREHPTIDGGWYMRESVCAPWRDR